MQALQGPIPPDEPPATPLPHAVGSALDSATHSFHHLHLNTHLKPHSARKQHAGAAAGASGASQEQGQGQGGGGPERLPGERYLRTGSAGCGCVPAGLVAAAVGPATSYPALPLAMLPC